MACGMKGRSTDASDNTQTSSIGYGSGKLWACCNVHASEEDWVLDAQEFGKGGLDLLWGSHDGGLLYVLSGLVVFNKYRMMEETGGDQVKGMKEAMKRRMRVWGSSTKAYVPRYLCCYQ